MHNKILITESNILNYIKCDYKELTSPSQVIDVFTIYLFSNNPDKQEASRIWLKMVLKENYYNYCMEWFVNNLEGIVTKRHDLRVKEWTRKIKNIGRCEKCGETQNLHAHHLAHWSKHPNSRISLNNGICLCEKCHAKAHEGEICYDIILNINKNKGGNLNETKT